MPWLVGLYITAAYWFTASISFANPAVSMTRALTDTFSGIPLDLPGFVLAQILGAACALALMTWLLRQPAQTTHPLRPKRLPRHGFGSCLRRMGGTLAARAGNGSTRP